MSKERETGDRRAFGERLKFLRKMHNETQSDLAKVLGFNSHQQVAYLETGARPVSIDKVIAIAKHYKISTDVLLGMEEDDKTSEEMRVLVKVYVNDEWHIFSAPEVGNQ